MNIENEDWAQGSKWLKTKYQFIQPIIENRTAGGVTLWIYQVKCKKNNIVYAMKIQQFSKAEDLIKYKNEVVLLFTLRHEHVIDVIDFNF